MGASAGNRGSPGSRSTPRQRSGRAADLPRRGLDRVEPIDPAVLRSLGFTGAASRHASRLAASIASMHEPVALVLDHAEAITNRECRDMITELALRLPAGSQLAIGSRREVPLPVARLRAQGGIVEIGVDDLAMTEQEARSLLGGAGVERAEDDGRRARRAHRGMAGRPLPRRVGDERREPAGRSTGFRFTGDDRFVGDYLRSEFLDRVSRADVAFLTRTSILDRMSRSALRCDRRRHGIRPSARSAGAPQPPGGPARPPRRVVPLPPPVPRAAARRADAARAGDGPRAAHPSGAVVRGERLPEAAIEHAQHAGDAERVARLVLKVANPVWASGRLDTVLRWMEWFSANDVIEQQPAIAVHGALIYALSAGGRRRTLGGGRRADHASAARCPTATPWRASLAYLRALLCRDGAREMRRDAQVALAGLSPLSPYRAAMLHAEGVADLLDGDLDQADLLFARAFDEATSAGVVPFIPVVLAERGIVAIERDDWPEAEALAARRWRSCGTASFDDYWTSALVYAWAARVAAPEGSGGTARDLAGRAARLRPLLTYALPVVSAQALLELARAYIALGDPVAPAPCCGRSTTSTSIGATSATSRRRPTSCRQARRCHGRDARGLVAHHGRAATAAAAAHPSLAGRDRRAAVRLPQHRQDPDDLDLPQVRRLEPGETITRMHELGLVTHP